jgi:hypothetical protein
MTKFKNIIVTSLITLALFGAFSSPGSAQTLTESPITLCNKCEGVRHCQSCDGTGLYSEDPCAICSGSGVCYYCDGTGRF